MGWRKFKVSGKTNCVLWEGRRYYKRWPWRRYVWVWASE